MRRIKARIRILVVDDQMLNRHLIAKRLEAEGYEVFQAENGPDAVQMFREELPDLVLLDLVMPGLSGIDVLDRLRDVREKTVIPVIVMSARDEVKDKVEALSGGADDYVTKPFNFPELLARIRAQLRIARLQRRLAEVERLRGVYEMAGAVCHELSQPLTALMGYTQMLLRDGDDPNREKLQQMMDAGERAVEILRKIRNIQRYETKPYSEHGIIIDIDRASRQPVRADEKQAGQTDPAEAGKEEV